MYAIIYIIYIIHWDRWEWSHWSTVSVWIVKLYKITINQLNPGKIGYLSIAIIYDVNSHGLSQAMCCDGLGVLWRLALLSWTRPFFNVVQKIGQTGCFALQHPAPTEHLIDLHPDYGGAVFKDLDAYFFLVRTSKSLARSLWVLCRSIQPHDWFWSGREMTCQVSRCTILRDTWLPHL